MAARLIPAYPYLAAEVVFACEQEYAETVVDVLARRTRVAFLNADAARAAIPSVLEVMAGFHGWDRGRQRAEAARASAYLTGMEAPPQPSGRHATQMNPEKLA